MYLERTKETESRLSSEEGSSGKAVWVVVWRCDQTFTGPPRRQRGEAARQQLLGSCPAAAANSRAAAATCRAAAGEVDGEVVK